MKRFLSVVYCLLAGVVLAGQPGWWTQEGTRIIDAEAGGAGVEENYAPANLGQLKNVAKKAKAHLDANLAGGAGSGVDALVAGFEPRSGQGYTQAEIEGFLAENYAPINLGQLKAVGKVFYDRLKAAGYDTKGNLVAHGYPAGWSFEYPWNPGTAVEENYAPANVGQLKVVFSFDLAGFDSDLDGLPDGWETGHFGNLEGDGSGDADLDGLTDMEEYQQGSDPQDYYERGSTTITPVVTVVAGNGQRGPANEYLAEGLKVEVRNGAEVLVNAPVVFTVESGGGGLSAETGSATTSATVTVRTDESGVAEVYYKQGPDALVESTVEGKAGEAEAVSFTSETRPREELWGHWRFNETSGTVADDASELEHDGTLENGPQWSARYAGEGAMEFDGATAEGGSNAYVTMGAPEDGELDFGEESFSVAVWVKYTETETPAGSAGRRIAGKGDEVGGYAVELKGDGKVTLTVGNTQSGGAALQFRTAGEYDGQWHQVVAVVDRTAATGRIYVDGEAAGLEKETGAPGVIDGGEATTITYTGVEHLSATAATAALTVGSKGGTTDYYKGGVDDLRLYRRALSAGEVAELYGAEGPLVAQAQNVTIDEDTLGTITLGSRGGGEGDAAVYEIVTEPENGEAVLAGNVVSYYPNAHYNGSDGLRFRVTKGGRTAEADVNITITPVDDPPLVSVGGAQSVTLPGTASLTATVTDIDTDAGEISVYWMKSSGPGEVTFGDVHAFTTTASFSEAGQYVLTAMGNDGTSGRSDSVVVVVNGESAINGPAITLQAPVDNAQFAPGVEVSIAASATASAGRTISKVEFYEGARKIGEATSANPASGNYELLWKPSRMGVYLVNAVATDSAGVTSSSAARVVRVSQGDWFNGSGTGPGNQGHAGTGGSGGSAEGSGSGPSGNHNNGGNGGGPTAGNPGDGRGNESGENVHSDSDGLSDAEEAELGTDPDLPDTDSDGVPDDQDGWSSKEDPETSKLLAPPRLAQVKYAVIDLGSGVPRKINNANQVLVFDSGNYAVWDKGVSISIPDPDGFGYDVSDINDAGTVVGGALTDDTYNHSKAYRWTKTGQSYQASALGEIDIGGVKKGEDISRFGAGAITNSGIIYGDGARWGVKEDAEDKPYKTVGAGICWTNGTAAIFGNIDEGDASHLSPVQTSESGLVLVGYNNPSDPPVWNSKIVDTSAASKLDIPGGAEGGDGITSINSTGHASGSNHGQPAIWVLKDGSYTERALPTGLDGHLNDRMEVVSGSYIWRNFKKYNLQDRIPAEWEILYAADINNNGVIAAYARKDDSYCGVLLVPVDMAVDANRDGFIKFAGNFSSSGAAGKPTDTTSEAKPFRFWINNDNDSGNEDHPGVGPQDSANDEISSMRDLEDFTRLQLYIGGLQEAVANNDIQVGLEWKNTTGSPSIKIFAQTGASGNGAYLKDAFISAFDQLGPEGKTALGTIGGSGGFKFANTFWENNASGRPAFDKDHPTRFLLFEGVTEGKGQLVITFWKGSTKIGEGGSVWLDLKDVRKMYTRTEAIGNIPFPPNYAYPSDGPPEPTMSSSPKDEGQTFDSSPVSWTETKQYIVFVHGWNMTYDGSKNYAETMFKRLWQEGYKGRFAFFRWPTLVGTVGTYNDSEFKAWKCGESLKQFVNSLEGGYTRNLVAHSMGNIVAGSALQKGMSVTNYSLMNAAVPAMCYDNDPALYQSGLTWKTPTPDGDADAGTRALGYGGQFQSVSGKLTNFYLTEDFATTTAWEANNWLFKPQWYDAVIGFVSRHYYYDPAASAGQKIGLRYDGGGDRFISTAHEAMAYADVSRTKAAGAEDNVSGSIQFGINMDDFNFETDHSAQFNLKIQLTIDCYDSLLSSFGILPNP